MNGENFISAVWRGEVDLHVSSPLDKIVFTDPKYVAEFMQGTRVIEERLKQIGSQVIIFPERGASPISWVLRDFISEQSILPIHLNLGTHIDVATGKRSGVTVPEKKILIKSELEYYIQTTQLLHPLSICLIDEVQSGGTISVAAQALRSLLDYETYPVLHVIALQSTLGQNGTKDRMYKNLTSNNNPNIETAVIPMPLFFVDRDCLLNSLLYQSDLGHNAFRMQHVLQNVEAQKLFTLLHALSKKTSEIDNYLLISELITYPIKKTNPDEVRQWINKYISACSEYR